jgi:hypothetical protein
MTHQGLESLNQALQARKAGEVEGREVEYVPPSEAQFAAAVARDLAIEVFSPANRAAWMVVAIAAMAVAVGFWLGRRSAERR